MMFQSDESHERSSNRPTHYEMEQYHDFIEEILASGFYDVQDNMTQQAMLIVRDVLCWVLGHDNPSMETNLKNWSNAYKKSGGLRDHYPN